MGGIFFRLELYDNTLKVQLTVDGVQGSDAFNASILGT
jgi:hypothetical protein